jgi:hypothetical protein
MPGCRDTNRVQPPGRVTADDLRSRPCHPDCHARSIVSELSPHDALTEVPVHAAVLDATADLLDLLSDFFTDTDHATRSRLGCFLVDRYGQENTTDSVTEAAVMLDQLSEAAELLHALADHGPGPDHG